MKRPILLGLTLGFLLNILFWNSGPYSADSGVLNFLVFISTPVAQLLSWISGWPLQQESAIYLYNIAILITLPLIGLLIGWLFAVVRARLNDRQLLD